MPLSGRPALPARLFRAPSSNTPVQGLPTLGAGAVYAQPRYVIESKPISGSTLVFRVTARSVGGQSDTIVILQAEYGY